LELLDSTAAERSSKLAGTDIAELSTVGANIYASWLL
jgi:hypothetical protein